VPKTQLLQRVYDGWDPEHVAGESRKMYDDVALLTAWGETARPRIEDTLPVPKNAEGIVPVHRPPSPG
jgi:hypothetical protein